MTQQFTYRSAVETRDRSDDYQAGGRLAWRWRLPQMADFVAEIGLEGRVGWADDFLRSRQGQRFAPAQYGAAALMHWKL